MNSVGIVYDSMTPAVKTQVVRDFIMLASEFSDLACYDVSGKMDTSYLDQLGVPLTTVPPVLYVVYKTGDGWPETPPGVPRVERDLKPSTISQQLSGEPSVGYFLPPQGRNGPNLTERYLNRSAPKGKGVVNPLVLLLWS